MNEPNAERVPESWIGREVVVKTLSTGLYEAMISKVEGFPRGRPPSPMAEGRFGKLENVHEGGIVLSRMGPPGVEEMGPVLFFPWNAVESLRLKVPPPDYPGTHEEEPRERAAMDRRSRRSSPLPEPKLIEVVPIARHESVAGITLTLRSLELHEGGRGLIGYLVSSDAGEERAPRYSIPEARVRDDRGRSYGTRVGKAQRGRSGELWLASVPGEDAAELEVEVTRLYEGPSGVGRDESLAGPWIFRFPL